LWQTAFNYGKILLSLDPHVRYCSELEHAIKAESNAIFQLFQTDPHGSLLWLDFLAIKANNIDWLDQVAETMNISHLPGFAYNRALGLRIKSQGKVCRDNVVLESVEALT
jgi:hypothetical protein